MKPNFFLIGAARSGTTSLHKYLEAHPEIFMSEVKEINYFSNNRYWEKGINWYESHFKTATEKIRGEASTSYTNYPLIKDVPKRLFHYLPDAKFIYILRDPIDRFLSHYLHRIRRGVESRQIDDIIENYPDDHLIWQGRYFSQLEQFLNFFPMERIHIITISDLKDEPDKTVRETYKFLNVDEYFTEVDLKTPHNVNKIITKKNWFGNMTLHFYRTYIEQRHFPYPFKKMFLQLAEIGAVEVEKPELTNRQLEKLKQYFREDIDNLERLLKREFNDWRNYKTIRKS